MTPDVHTLTGPYVLNALPDDERAEFEQHLQQCASCIAEVAELRESATRLGSAVAAVPPPALKAKVMASIDNTRQLPPLLSPDRHPAEPAAVQRRYRRRSLLALAAAAVAVAGSGAVAIDQYRDRTAAERQSDQLAAILSENDARTVHSAVAGGGQATVVMSLRKDNAVVLLHGLRRLPDDRTYQLWLIDKSQVAHSVGLTRDDQTRFIDGGLADKLTFGLTVEPRGGSAKPTLPAAALVPMT